METNQVFARTVALIIDKSKLSNGGVKRLCEVTGRNTAILSQWRRGVYLPKLADRLEFLRKATEFLRELALEREQHEKEAQELLKELEELWA